MATKTEARRAELEEYFKQGQAQYDALTPAQRAELDALTESYWLIAAKQQLKKRDPLDAIRDVETLLRWCIVEFDTAIDEACIDNILHSTRLDTLRALRRLEMHTEERDADVPG